MPGSWNDSQITNQLNSGILWTASNLTYGFPTSASWFPYAEKKRLLAPERRPAKRGDAGNRAVGRSDRQRHQASSSPNTANIKLSNTTSDIGYAHAYSPGSSAAAGSVWFNPATHR